MGSNGEGLFALSYQGEWPMRSFVAGQSRANSALWNRGPFHFKWFENQLCGDGSRGDPALPGRPGHSKLGLDTLSWVAWWPGGRVARWPGGQVARRPCPPPPALPVLPIMFDSSWTFWAAWPPWPRGSPEGCPATGFPPSTPDFSTRQPHKGHSRWPINEAPILQHN